MQEAPFSHEVTSIILSVLEDLTYRDKVFFSGKYRNVSKVILNHYSRQL